jgi:hypothetical protein
VTGGALDRGRPKVAVAEWAPGALAFAVPFAAYLITLARSITFGDSGEMTVAAAALGIGHPPGYPFAALAGQLPSLLPFGGVAWKTNLGSAAAMAAACLVVFLLLKKLFLALRPEARVPAAVTAAAMAVAFGLGKTVWSQAVTTEVYAFNALAVAAILYAALTFVRGRDPRWAYAAAFGSGLALSIHFSSALVIVPTWVYMWVRAKRPPSWRALWLGAAVALLGLLVYIYLPIRAAQGPALNWGDPKTLPAALAHVSRKNMGGISLARLGFLPHHLWELALTLGREFTPALFVAAAAGVVIAFVRRLKAWRFLAALALVTGPVATALLVMALRADQVAEIHVWYIPFFLTAAAFAGLALFLLQTRTSPALRGAGYVAAVGVAALPLAFNFGLNDLREYPYAEDYGGNLLRTLDYCGIGFFFERDFGSFEIAYHRNALGRRPDTEFVSPLVGVLPGFGSLARDMAATEDDMEAAIIESRFEAELLPLSAERGIYYNGGRETVLALGYHLRQTGLLYRVEGERADRERPDAAALWERYATRGFADVEAHPASPRFREDNWLRHTMCIFLIKKAFQCLEAGDTDEAFAALARAEPVAEGLFEPLGNLGSIYLAQGQPEKAVALFERAARAVPRAGGGDEFFRLNFAQILARKGDAYMAMGDAASAEEAYREAREAYAQINVPPAGRR